MSERQESGSTYVYRCYDNAGQALYIGMTNDLVRRMNRHVRSHWIWDVASITAETYPTRKAAHAAEIAAIRSEDPRWNVEHKINRRQAWSESLDWERRRYTDEWPSHASHEYTVLMRKLRRMTWPIQYGCTLPPLDETGEIAYY